MLTAYRNRSAHRYLPQVDMDLFSIHNKIHLGRCHKLERRSAPSEISGPVVDLDAGDDRIVGGALECEG